MQYSLNYFRKNKLLKDLAYETGIHLGDGYLGYFLEGYHNKFRYALQYTGDAINELHFYKTTLKPLLFKLYGINLPIKFKKDNTCIFVTRSSKLAKFKKSLGLPVGRKINIKIPNFISTKNLKINFIRGLFDTDASLSFKKKHKKINYYPVIHYTSNDKELIVNVAKILNELKIKFCTYFDEIKKDKRPYIKDSIIHNIYINGIERLEDWMNKIGFYSSKHLTKYLIWKKLGYLNLNLTTEDRLNIIKDLKIKMPG